jgi:hypothetical protein
VFWFTGCSYARGASIALPRLQVAGCMLAEALMLGRLNAACAAVAIWQFRIVFYASGQQRNRCYSYGDYEELWQSMADIRDVAPGLKPQA